MESCLHCGAVPTERTVRIRAQPRPGPAGAVGLYIVTDIDTGKDISGVVPADTPFDGALPGDRIRGRIWTSDPAHVRPFIGDVCSNPAIYEVA